MTTKTTDAAAITSGSESTAARPIPRPIPRVIVPALLGGLAITALLVAWVFTTLHIAGFARDRFDNAWWEVLAVSSSGLFVLCGPIVLVLTYAYYQRRRRNVQLDDD
jgi:hypothetical protein